MTTSWWSQVWAIVWKDIMLERRTKQSVATMLVFSVIIIVTFNFALEADLAAARSVSLGLLWVIIWLAGTLGINRSFSAETDDHALDALLIAPIPRGAIYAGKCISLFLTLLATEAVLVPLMVMFFNRPFYRPMVLLVIVLGTIGYVAAGTFIGSMAAQTRSSYLLVPILMLPLTLPIVLAAAIASAEFMQDNPLFEAAWLPLVQILLYDILMLTVGTLFYNYVVEE